MAPPGKKWIDKKSATTFQVRHRSQKDPLIYDESATNYVLTAVQNPNANKPGSTGTQQQNNPKIKTSHGLESELGIDGSAIRANEGEAAMYGIYYDDTKYDYMQHLRSVGTKPDAVFIEASQSQSAQNREWGKGKGQSLDQALADNADSWNSEGLRIPKELLPCKIELKRTYQDQQNVPDALKGFQPDMDPRLREVLEALEDDAYVDDDEDLFGELSKAGECAEDEFFDAEFDEDDGWGSDTTEKPNKPTTTSAFSATATKGESTTAETQENEDWVKEFSKFKKDQKKTKAKKDINDENSSMAGAMIFGGTSLISGGSVSIPGRRRRRRERKDGGARTTTSGYSMSSSALFRTEGLTLLDDRFDRIEAEYNIGSDEEEEPLTEPVSEVRQDFDQIMDEFLGGYSMTGARPKTHRIRRGKYQSGDRKSVV